MNTLKNILIGFIFLFITIPAIGQSNFIAGKIIDKETGEDLISANVFNLTNKKGSITNSYGFFSIEIVPNIENKIHVGYVGYTDTVVVFKPDLLKNIEIKLCPGTVLSEITAYSAESGHPFRELTDTFLEIFFVIKLKHFIHFFSKFFSLIHPVIRYGMNH